MLGRAQRTRRWPAPPTVLTTSLRRGILRERVERLAEARIRRVPPRDALELSERDAAARRDRMSHERVFLGPAARALGVTLHERRDAFVEPRRKVPAGADLSHHVVGQLVLEYG